jgi:hypothetical protein
MKILFIALLLSTVAFAKAKPKLGAGNTQKITATSPLSLSAGLLSIPLATNLADGYLSSTDWNTFNGKQASGSYITALTGDVSASGPGSAAATISAATVTGKLLTGLSASAGTILATDSVLQAFNKAAGNFPLLATLASPTFTGTVTLPTGAGVLRSSSGGAVSSAELSGDVTTSASNATTVAKIQGTTVSGTTGTGNVVLGTSPTISGSPSIKSGNCHIDPTPTAVTCNGTSNLDLSTFSNFLITLTGACTITQSNPQDGCPYYFKFKEGGSGGYSLSLPGSWHWPFNTTPLWDTTLNHWNTAACVWDNTNSVQSCSGLTNFQ